MLVIRDAQMEALRIEQEAAFRRRLLRYARTDCGAMYAESDDAAVLDVIEWAIRKGLRGGIFRPADLDPFVRFVLRHGRDFEKTVAGAASIMKGRHAGGRARLEALEALIAETPR
jgi:hypothetical protein